MAPHLYICINEASFKRSNCSFCRLAYHSQCHCGAHASHAIFRIQTLRDIPHNIFAQMRQSRCCTCPHHRVWVSQHGHQWLYRRFGFALCKLCSSLNPQFIILIRQLLGKPCNFNRIRFRRRGRLRSCHLVHQLPKGEKELGITARSSSSSKHRSERRGCFLSWNIYIII